MILELKKDLSIQQGTEEKPEGKLVFEKAKFGIIVKIIDPDSLNKKMALQLHVIRLSDNEPITRVGNAIIIQLDGVDSETMTNEQEYNDYISAFDSLSLQIKTLRLEIEDISPLLLEKQLEIKQLDADIEALKELIKTEKDETAKELLEDQLDEKLDLYNTAKEDEKILGKSFHEKLAEKTGFEKDLLKLEKVEPQFIKENLYDDIIGTHIINNELTESGLAWLKTLPLHDKTIGDHII